MSNVVSFSKLKFLFYFIGIPLIGSVIQRNLTRDLILTQEILSTFLICTDTIISNLDKFPLSSFLIEKLKEEI